MDLFKKHSSTDESTVIAQKLRSSAIKSTQSLNMISSPSKSSISSDKPATAGGAASEAIELPKSPLEVLANKVEELKVLIEEQEDIYRQLSSDRRDQQITIESEAQQVEQLRKEKKLKTQVAMLLDDPEESKEKLQLVLEAGVKRMENLNVKFETHKQPLVQQLEALSDKNSSKLQKMEVKQVELQQIRRNVAEIQEDIRVKAQVYQQLQTELTNTKRVTERQAYTSRIVDIIKSIKRQNNDINVILKDTRTLQKAINTITGQLERQFQVTDDFLFQVSLN